MLGSKNIENKIRIAESLVRYLLGVANRKECEKVTHWLTKDPNNQKLLEDLRSLENREKRKDFIQSIDTEKNWKVFSKRIKPKNTLLPLSFKYVAIVIPFLIFLGYWLLTDRGNSQRFFVEKVEIAPGIKEAQLQLESGELVELSGVDILMTNKDSTIQISNKNRTLNYKEINKDKNLRVDKNQNKVFYHELRVSKGQEYHLILSDGTEVWLNSDSHLKYPITFSTEKREVILSGEAYFSVKENKGAPFIVKTERMDIKVLGTEFNVSAYTIDQKQHATLVEGKIVATLNNTERTSFEILPNQQLTYDSESSKYSVKLVEAEDYGCWREGLFVFDEEDLEEITNKLSRWYNISFFFQNKSARKQKFTGKLPRFENCEVVLEMIEKTANVKFKANKQGTSVVVSTVW